MPHSQSQWATFFEAVRDKSGLDLGMYKQSQLQRRIVAIANSKGVRRLDRFAEWLCGDADAMTWFLDRLAINVSELFRNPERWAELEEKVLPTLLDGNRRLKAWSAGCSYGAEAYTLAAILARRHPGTHRVLGTDIDQAALAQARQGTFSDADMRSVPKNYRFWFTRSSNHWKASAELKRHLEFRTGNLLADRFETGFDLIICRNVVIYFSDEAKHGLFERFYASLSPGGYLFVGGSERIFNARDIGFDTALPFFYRKPLMGDHRAWRNAS